MSDEFCTLCGAPSGGDTLCRECEMAELEAIRDAADRDTDDEHGGEA